ncbi:MAG: DUF4159 domain-containing protein [Alphaproteobacteria bacterium]|nr:DUF4159 domain-containing protein [Alphaproteobacteria bacterium]
MTLSFLTPLALLPLLALPLLWWIIRRRPPLPRAIPFPAMRFLTQQPGTPPPNRRPPWWLLLLRLGLLAGLILALAHPVLMPDEATPMQKDAKQPLAVIVDTGWAAAQNWEPMMKAARLMIEEAGRMNRPVALIPTGETVANLSAAPSALAALASLAPHPWPVARAPSLDALRRLNQPADKLNIAWLSDGLGTKDDLENFTKELGKLGALTIFSPAADDLPFRVETDENSLRVSRFVPGKATVVGTRGDTGLTASAAFGTGGRSVNIPLEPLAPVWRTTARLALEGQRHAAAVWLRSPRAQGKIVIAGQNPTTSDQPLLTDTYYLHKALAPHADIVFASLTELPLKGASIVILPDGPPPPPDAEKALETWVKQGGVLLRFAGPQLLGGLAPESDALLPVRLLPGDRHLGGNLTWENAQHLKAPSSASPLARLGTPPEDVTVLTQALAAPDTDLQKHTWLALADGTPIISAAPLERGWRILVHVPSMPGLVSADQESAAEAPVATNGAWSNFPLSGYFENFLRLLPELGSAGDTAISMEGTLIPFKLLDGFGTLVPADDKAKKAVRSEDAKALLPPGLYRSGGFIVPRNLGPEVKNHLPLSALGIASQPYADSAAALDLQPWLLGLALSMLLLDWSLLLLPLSWRFRKPATAVILLAALLHAPAFAAPKDEDAAAKTRLAYIITGDADVDTASERGLTGLSEILTLRTSFRPAPPAGVRLESDALAFYPLLYWPMLPGQQPLSSEALSKLRGYMRGGGMLLLDTKGETAGTLPLSGVKGAAPDALTALATVVGGLELGSLASLPENHTMRRSFYLLKTFSGRHTHPLLLVERENPRQNDGVSPVVIGSNDWAYAWAKDANVPHSQQEEAWRFGVNLVMYALTGNYKTDQIHLDTILRRLGRDEER